VSAQDRQRFHQTLAAARKIATPWECPVEEAKLRSAESDFQYAQQARLEPERARQIAAQAQHDAETAFERCRAGTAYRGQPRAKTSVADVF
jgi:hypothetical protein